jgi:hypothetical protein
MQRAILSLRRNITPPDDSRMETPPDRLRAVESLKAGRRRTGSIGAEADTRATGTLLQCNIKEPDGSRNKGQTGP